MATKKAKATETMTLSTFSMRDPSTVKISNEHGPSADQPPSGSIEDEIRVLAYYKWESAECPESDGVEFWLEAEREINAAQPTPIAAKESAQPID